MAAGSRGKYKTKHYYTILDYIKSKPTKHYTAAEIDAAFSGKDKNIGTATVYRNLERMVEEGILTKYYIDKDSAAYYQYLDPESHSPKGTCYHLRCEVCGRLVHLHCKEVDEFKDHMLREHSFHLDPMRTVFYGICDECAGIKRIQIV
jgi:Fur family ferric uptake transcriptional regulator